MISNIWRVFLGRSTFLATKLSNRPLKPVLKWYMTDSCPSVPLVETFSWAERQWVIGKCFMPLLATPVMLCFVKRRKLPQVCHGWMQINTRLLKQLLQKCSEYANQFLVSISKQCCKKSLAWRLTEDPIGVVFVADRCCKRSGRLQESVWVKLDVISVQASPPALSFQCC